MNHMNKIDWLELDPKLLRLLVTVVECGSVTGAAERLGLTQSSVSHGLDRLRAIVGHPLFVKSGRGIACTAQAELLARRARDLLQELRAFSVAADFEPAKLVRQLTLAGNDLQRDLLFPRLIRRLRAQAPGLQVRVMSSGAPGPDMLREERCDLLVTPRPPQGSDIMQKRLFADRYQVFFDASQRAAPNSRADYLAADHVTVVYDPGRSLDVDQWLGERKIRRNMVVTVPGMAALASMVQGSAWLATAPSLLAKGALSALSHAPVPVPTPTLPMFMVWHLRQHSDPAHRWLRGELQAVVDETL